MKKHVLYLLLIMLVYGLIFINPVYAVKHVLTVGNSLNSPSASVNTSVLIDSLVVTPASQNVPAGGGTTSFSVTSNSTWTTESTAYWCFPNPPVGYGNGTMTATCSMNNLVTQRIAHLRVMVSATLYQWVTVVQAGAIPALNVTPSNRDVTDAAGSTTFTVISNSAWTAESSESWCTATASGYGNGTLVANYTENTIYSPRVSTITVMASGVPNQTVTVTQAATRVGFEEQAQNGFQVYPNPSRGLLKLSTGENGNQPVTVNIVNLNGINILSGVYSGSGEYTFDLSQTPRGYYFVKISTDRNTMVRRVVLID